MDKYRLNVSTSLHYFHCRGNGEELIIAYVNGITTFPDDHDAGEEFFYEGDINDKIILSSILFAPVRPSAYSHYVVPESYFINFFERVD